MHNDEEVERIIGSELEPSQYRAGLEKIYPMIFSIICFTMFGTERVGDLLCT